MADHRDHKPGNPAEPELLHVTPNGEAFYADGTQRVASAEQRVIAARRDLQLAIDTYARALAAAGLTELEQTQRLCAGAKELVFRAQDATGQPNDAWGRRTAQALARLRRDLEQLDNRLEYGREMGVDRG